MLLIKALHYHLLLELDIKLRPYPTKWTWPEHKQVHYWQKVQYFEDQLVHLAFPYHQWRLGTWVRSDILWLFSLFVCCMSCSELHGYCRSTTYWLMIDWGRKLCELCELSAQLPSGNNNGAKSSICWSYQEYYHFLCNVKTSLGKGVRKKP